MTLSLLPQNCTVIIHLQDSETALEKVPLCPRKLTFQPVYNLGKALKINCYGELGTLIFLGSRNFGWS